MVSQNPSIESVLALNGHVFAMLTPDELQAFEFYRAQGRKCGLAVSIDSPADPAELAKATSQAAADEIMRRVNSTVLVERMSPEAAGEAAKQEAERVKNVREYFEIGCLCIAQGTLEKLSGDTPDSEAAAFYERSCKCSRNYSH